MFKNLLADDLLARALGFLAHRPLLGGDDEPETLANQFVLFGPIGAYVRQPECDCMMPFLNKTMVKNATSNSVMFIKKRHPKNMVGSVEVIADCSVYFCRMCNSKDVIRASTMPGSLCQNTTIGP